MKTAQISFKIASLIADKAEGSILIGGDFNCVLKASVDRHPADFSPRSKKTFTLCALMDELGLVDVWRTCALQPFQVRYVFDVRKRFL